MMSHTRRALRAGLAGAMALVLWSCGTTPNGSSSVAEGGNDATGPADGGGAPFEDSTTGDDADATAAQDATGADDADATVTPDATGGDDAAGGRDTGGDDVSLDSPQGEAGSDDGGGDAGTGDAAYAGDAADSGDAADAGADSGQDAGCVPMTCAELQINCGGAPDGCGGTVQCGACPVGQTCGATSANVCGGGSVTCTGLCLMQQTCPGTATTSVSGTVFAPNGVDPLPGVLVYVPNAPLMPFKPGVSCGACGAEVSGSPLVQTTSGVDGKFTLSNLPVGTNIPLVIQSGRWRRQMVIANVAACVNTALPTSQTRMPRTKAEGDIPLMGFVTGSVDALECELRKIGIADSEFSDPSGAGRVRFYQGAGGGGATYSATTPSETQLWGSQGAINQYDMVYFACQGSRYDKTAAEQQVVINFANAGGRVLATHYSYVWLFNDAPFSTTATWAVDTNGSNVFPSDQTAFVNTSFPRGLALAQWLQVIGASTTLGQIPLVTLRDDFTGVVPPSEQWLSVHDATLGNVPMHYTFETPVGAAPANQCGRVLFNDYHVENATTSGTTFPAECTPAVMSPQEKMLEYDIFDLGACVTPASCTPRTCADTGASCGPQGDGCGNILQCGTCPTGQSCGGGGVAGACGSGGAACTPKTCTELGFNCGLASDGCGGVINCGSCAAPAVCGGGGKPNVCGGGA